MSHWEPLVSALGLLPFLMRIIFRAGQIVQELKQLNAHQHSQAATLQNHGQRIGGLEKTVERHRGWLRVVAPHLVTETGGGS